MCFHTGGMLRILSLAIFNGILAEDGNAPALQKDDECLAIGGCALNALQLRSETDPEMNETDFKDLDHINPDDQELLASMYVYWCYRVIGGLKIWHNLTSKSA